MHKSLLQHYFQALQTKKCQANVFKLLSIPKRPHLMLLVFHKADLNTYEQDLSLDVAKHQLLEHCDIIE